MSLDRLHIEDPEDDQATEDIEDAEEQSDDYDELDLSSLTIEQVKYLKLQQKQAEVLGSLVRQITLLEGKKGRGKTLAGVAIAYKLKELFDLPTVCVGTSLELNENYGEHVFIDEKEFVNQLDALTTISKRTSDEMVGNSVEQALRKMGVDIANSVLIFDEAYKLFDSRTPSDKLVRIFGYFISQARHYKVTVILMCPSRDMLDKRIRRQIDVFGRCFTNKRTGVTMVRLAGGLETRRLNIYGPTYWKMYNTYSLVGFRQKHLSINQF
jgi:SpoVK/Ycf46/Vps4 family AAA+-type ATPase